MRKEAEMMALILDTARTDERVRAVEMNGSRADPSAPADKYRDYDIVYYVSDVESFTRDHAWIDRFGERIMLQMPETMRGSENDGHFPYLILFRDGNRIDLSLVTARPRAAYGEIDSHSIALMDKDGILPDFPTPDDSSYLIKRPPKLDFDSCCNDFWWCAQNVAKGVARDELPYAMGMLEVIRREFLDMIRWAIGVRTDFSVTAGKMGKYIKKFLSDEEYDRYLRTYPECRADAIFDAMAEMGKLFRLLGREVAEALGYAYPEADDAAMLAYLEIVRGDCGGTTEASGGKLF